MLCYVSALEKRGTTEYVVHSYCISTVVLSYLILGLVLISLSNLGGPGHENHVDSVTHKLSHIIN